MSLKPDEGVGVQTAAHAISDKGFKGVIARLCHDAPQAGLGYVLAIQAVAVLTVSYRLSDTPAYLLMLFGCGLGGLSLTAFYKAVGQLDRPPPRRKPPSIRPKP
jgi:hypothetical protein